MRGAQGSSHGNTVTYKTVILYFQRFPGKDASSGIADEEYVFKIGGKQVAKGNLGAQGNVSLRLPAGSTGILEIFGSQFEIKVAAALQPKNTDKGAQQRLKMLGYELGAVDGIVGPKTDRAALNFQADNSPLVVDGIAGPNTQNKLKDIVGE